MKMPSNRIEAIIRQVELYTEYSNIDFAQKSLADIGADHAYISKMALQRGLVKNVIITDINKMPIERAKENMTKAGLANLANFILTDGLKKVPQTDIIVIGGMGGHLVADIIQKGREKVAASTLQIYQPMHDIDMLRQYLGKSLLWNYYFIDDGKWYEIIVAGTCVENSCKVIDFSGIKVHEENLDSFKKYLDASIHKSKRILREISSGNEKSLAIIRYQKMIEEYVRINDQLSCYLGVK